MKNLIIITVISALGLTSIYARENSSVDVKKPNTVSTRVGKCNIGKTQTFLDINNVRAMLLNSGDMWWNRTIAQYGVPKISNQQLQNGERQVSPIFSGAIWISGKDNGNLKIAAIRFSSGSSVNFWPGPIKQGALTIDKAQCEKFDKFWSVTSVEVDNARLNGVYSDVIKNWPGKGNKYAIANGSLNADDLQDDLAPFYDSNNDGIYDHTDGDYPAIKQVAGGSGQEGAVADQMIFWVINDVGNAHSVPDGTPIGVQMNCLAFAFQTSDELNNMTFYTYDVHNKSNATLTETFMTQFVDCDLGNYNDDYVGCDTVRDVGICYNADAFDQNTSTLGYLDQVPILAADFFEGPKDANGNQLGMSSFVYFVNSQGQENSDPSTDIEHRNFQEGRTRTGKFFTAGGDCLSGTVPTKYCFPGNPVKGLPEWSMCSVGYPARDLRFMINSGPFEMKGGSSETVTTGIIFVQPPVGSYTGCQIDFEKHLFTEDEKAQRLFDNKFQQSKGPDAPDLQIIESDRELYVSLSNLPSSNNVGQSYDKPDLGIPNKPGIADTTYTFEGYMIFQVNTPTVSSFKDLMDDTKSKLVKKMDIVNKVTTLVEYNDVNGVYIPINEITFSNSGIENEFVISQDLFEQEGQKNLVNEKPYYFAAIAVAYNDYNDGGVKQIKQYKISDKIKVFTATPYNNNYYGKKTNSKFGQYLDITRKVGQGHANYFLDIIKSHEEDIVKDFKKDVLTYVGGKAPINVVVNNPFDIREADFTLKLFDTSSTNTNPHFFRTDSSFWELNINNGERIITSESNIDRPTSQSIYAQINNVLTPYGITLNTGVASDPIGTVNRTGNAVYKFIGAALSYEDSSKKWLQFITDQDDSDYLDWIRGGEKKDTFKKYLSAYNVINNNRVYTDPTKEFDDILGGIIAPYCITANNNLIDLSSEANTYASDGPAFKWNRITTTYNASNVLIGEGPENNLDSIFSVEIVITPDKQKWSECLVLETGESKDLNEFGAIKGQLRKAPSRDMDMNIGTGIGKSFFPGYAINLETGVRVNIYFGENSRMRGQGSANMIWDPNSNILTSLSSPIMAGGQYVYVTNTPYDAGDAHWNILNNNFNVTTGSGVNEVLNREVANVYRSFAWTFLPVLDSASSFYDAAGVYKIPSEVRLKVRVQKPYGFYLDGGAKYSEYSFSTKGLAPVDKDSLRKSAFDNMTIIPNPYNAYSIYEANEAQNIVKFVNVPKGSTISIFTTDGILVRKVKLNSQINKGYLGANVSAGDINTDNAYIWDMRTSAGVLISSGVYYIHVDAPDFGSKVMKLFATMRSPDVSNF